MAFSDILNDPTNQIRVSRGVAPNTGLAEGIRAATGIVGSLVADVRENRDTQRRDKLIDELQKEFLPLTQAVQQGKITEQEMNTTIDARLRNVKSNNPWRAADIDKWVKEDLGLRPRGNTLTREMDVAKVQAEVSEKLFQEAMSYNLTAFKDDGTIDRGATIVRMQEVNGVLLQMKLVGGAAGSGGGGTGSSAEETRARKQALTDSIYNLHNASVIPAMMNIYNEAEKLQGDEVSKVAALRETINQNKLRYQLVLQQQLAGHSLEASDYDEILNGAMKRFDTLEASIVSDDWGTVRRNIRLVQELNKQYGNKAAEALAPTIAISEALAGGGDVSAAIVSRAIGSNTAAQEAISGMAKDFGTMFKDLTLMSKTVNAASNPSSVPMMTTGDKKAVTKGLQAGVDVGVKKPLDEAEVPVWSNTVTAQSQVVRDTGMNFDNAINYVKRIDNPNFYNNLKKSYDSGSKEAVDEVANTARVVMTRELDSVRASNQGIPADALVYNPNIGKFQINPTLFKELGEMRRAESSERETTNLRSTLGLDVGPNLGGVANAARSMMTGFKELGVFNLQKDVDNLNKYLNVYSKTRSIQGIDESNVRHTAAKALGVTFTRPVGNLSPATTVQQDFSKPTQPTNNRRRIKVIDGKPQFVTE